MRCCGNCRPSWTSCRKNSAAPAFRPSHGSRPESEGRFPVSAASGFSGYRSATTRLGSGFLDRPFCPGRFYPSASAPNSLRVLSAEGVRLFLAEVEARARSHGWTGDEHFGADGARVESWASLESFVRQHGRKAQKLQAGKEEDPGHPTLDFGGQTRSHATHRRRADPDSGWDRKAPGEEARLGLGRPVLRDNRRGLGAEFRIQDSMAELEPEVALQPVATVEALPSGVRGRTAGATRPSPVSVCGGLLAVGVAPEVACKHGLRVAGLDRRTTARSGYRLR